MQLKQKQTLAHTAINLELLESPVKNWNGGVYDAPPTPCSSGPLANKLLDFNGVQERVDENYDLDMCTACA